MAGLKKAGKKGRQKGGVKRVPLKTGVILFKRGKRKYALDRPKPKPAARAKARVKRLQSLPTLPTTDAPFTDARGSLRLIAQTTALCPIGSVVYMTREAGTVSAEHFHRDSSHLCLLLSGSMVYHERPVGSKAPATKILIHEGQVFWTPPMVEHAFEHITRCELIVLGDKHRDQKNYERDLVRLTDKLVGQETE